MELQFITSIDGVDMSLHGGSEHDKSITALTIDWRLIVDTDARGIKGMYPIVGKIQFTHTVEAHDEEFLAEDEEKQFDIVLESAPDFSDNYEDKDGNKWSVEIEYDKAGRQYTIEDFWVDLDDRRVTIEFSDTTLAN